MASTNKTTHYDLSQYVASDKPTYLGDYNTDMSKIDTGINSAQTTADSAATSATNAQTTAETAQTTANTAVTNAATADTKATTANTNIGTMANLTTTEKGSLVGAINEVDLHADTANNAIGTIANLTTDVKTDLVSAINSIETKVEELDNFSIDEADTGMKWIDGKKIYRKTFNVNIQPESYSDYTLWSNAAATIDKIINSYGFGKSSSGSEIQLPSAHINIALSGTDNNLKIQNDGGFASVGYLVTVEYTKKSQ